ncbi:hypothetical protein GQ53DRAFT_129643 [Thozetella sp. PMI_491]|nr:hypothetical protein GQ53DRAFT_129643 [Thozetella sp. PMI_491]
MSGASRLRDNISVLRDKIDYGDRSEPRFAALNGALKVCAARFRTNSGIPGVDLVDWRDRAHQAGLDEMTSDFLDLQGKGLQFWPDTPASPYYNKYSYIRDKAFIRDVVKKLFFRLNAQTNRNHRYKANRVENQKGSSKEPDGIPRAGSELSHCSTPTMSNFASTQSEAGGQPQADMHTDELPTYQANPAINPPEVSNIPDRDPKVNPLLRPVSQQDMDGSPKTLRTKRARQSDPATDSNKRTKRLIPGERSTNRLRRPTQKLGSFVGNEALEELAAYEQDTSSTAVNPRRQLSNDDDREDVMREDNVYDVPVDEDSTSFIDPHLIDLTIEGSDTADHNRPGPVGNIPSGQPENEPLVEASEGPSGEEGVQLPAEAARQPQPIERQAQPLAEVPSQVPVIPIENPGQAPTKPTEDLPARPVQSHIEHTENSDPAKPSIAFVYRTQVSPTGQCMRWYPEGRFQDRKLSDLMRELMVSPVVPGLVFTILGLGVPIVDRILRDDEVGFESLKRHINRTIRRCLSRQRQPGGSKEQGPCLLVEILIESIVSDTTQPAEEELKDLELDWW